jgi:uncharacterized membrane protein
VRAAESEHAGLRERYRMAELLAVAFMGGILIVVAVVIWGFLRAAIGK